VSNLSRPFRPWGFFIRFPRPLANGVDLRRKSVANTILDTPGSQGARVKRGKVTEMAPKLARHFAEIPPGSLAPWLPGVIFSSLMATDVLSKRHWPLAWANELPRRWRSSMDIGASSLPFEAQRADNSFSQANGQCYQARIQKVSNLSRPFRPLGFFIRLPRPLAAVGLG
jgi:hypothetical protein